MKVTVENYGDEFAPQWVVDVEGFTVIDYGDCEAAYDTAEEYAGKMRKLLASVRVEGVKEGIYRVRKFSMVDDGGVRYPVSANDACAMAESTFAEEQQR